MTRTGMVCMVLCVDAMAWHSMVQRHVTVCVKPYLPGMDGVKEAAKDRVTCTFEPFGFDLKVCQRVRFRVKPFGFNLKVCAKTGATMFH